MERKRSASVETVETVAEQFMQRYVMRKNKPDTAKGVQGMLNTHIVPKWRGRLITDITRKDIVELIEGMATETPIAANRVAGVISKLFAWCVSQSKLQSSPYVGVEKPSQEVSRERTLTDTEIKAVWNASADIGSFGPIVRLLLLTAQRRDEVRRMKWSELDLSAKTWTLPAARTKNAQPHVVPLSAEAIAVLESIEKTDDEYVFRNRGTFPAHHRPKEKLDKLTGIEERWTFHDLRRTAASKMAELGADVATIEKILNHTSGVFRGVAGTYQRHSFLREKTAALATWGKYVAGLVGTDSRSNIVPLKASAL